MESSIEEKTSVKIGHPIWAAIDGVLASFYAYAGISNLLDYTSLKVAVYQAQLANVNNVTSEAIEMAKRAAEEVPMGDYFFGLGFMCLASFFSALTVYHATRDEGG